MRKTFKQVLALVLCLCMCISLLPAPVLAEGNEDPSAAETELEPEEASVQSGDGGNEGDPDGPTYYTITFNATMSYFEDDGPTDDDARKIRSIQLEYGQSAGEIYFGELAEVDGFRFDGWCTDTECTDLIPDLDSWYPAGDATYYAKWTDLDTIDDFVVTFDACGGHFAYNDPTFIVSVPKYSSLSDALDMMETVPETDDSNLIWTGMWSESAGGEPIGDVSQYIINGDITLYAVWTEAVMLTFDPNGGYFDDQTTYSKKIKVPHGTAFSEVPAVYPANENSVFRGWFEEPDCTGESVDFSDYFLATRDMILYAGWEEQETSRLITLHANGGYFSDSSEEDSADLKTFYLPEDSELFGDYSVRNNNSDLAFAGWYFDEDCTEYAFGVNEYFTPQSDLDLYAKWVYGYVVTFNAGSGYFDEEGNNTYVCAVVPGHTIPDDPGMSNLDENLDFLGWYLTPECDGEQIYPYEYIPEGDVTLYARWVQTYTVTFNANGGYFGDSENNETLSTVHFRAGDSVGGSWGVVHSDGHMAFTGWYFDENCTELACNSETPYYPDRDVTLYAGWTAGYLVTFDAGSGYFGEEGNTMATHTVAAGQTISYEPGMSNQDESLECWGWYLTPECDGEEINPYEYIPEGDVTLYARWVRTYTVTFNANGGYFGDSENNETLTTVRFRDGDCVGGSWGVVHSDAHMAFTGWYFDENCTELACDANTEYYPDHDVTLYAGWEEGYIVTFDATGGKFDENDSSSISVTVRKNQTLDTNYQPYHENETLLFGGWYDQPNGEGNRIHPWNYVVKSDVTFYAKWNQTYQITFHANEEGAYFWKNGEKAPSNSIRFTAGSIIDGNVGAMNDNPARLLEGWYFDAECTRPAASRIMPYTVSEDIILYAKWEDSVIVTYEANDGDDATFPNGEKTLVKYSTPGDIVGWTVKPTNTNENRIFDGWNREQDGSGETVDTYSFIPEQNVTLYASWAQAWNVTFDGNGGFINSNNPASSYSVKVRDGNTVSSVLQNPVSAANVDQTQILDYWSYDRGGTSRADNPFGTPITGNITLYAQFAEGVAVHWISGGNSLYTQYVKKGSYLTSAPGHTWYWDSACTQSADVFNVQINEETTFYLTGNNQEDKITVTFDLDGGMFRSSPLSEPETELTVIVSKGQPVIDEMESIPYFIDAGLVRGYHKDGFSFAGWTSARGGTDDFDFTQSFDQDITVYAKWKPGFLLTLDGNDHLIYDGIFARSRTIELNIPADGTIMEALSRWDETIMSGNSARNESGKILEGWYYDKACTVPVEADDPAATVTVYAKWTVPYHITVDANGGFIYSPEGMYVVPGRPIKMVYYIEPGDDQYILIGWSLDRAGTQMIDDIDAFIPTGDTTIYAQWIKGSVVRFVSDIPFFFGYGYFEKNIPAGESVGSMNLDDGCELMIEGWYLDRDLTRSIGALEDYVPTGSVTLYAKWGERNPVEVLPGLTVVPKSGVTINLSWNSLMGAYLYEVWAGTSINELSYVKSTSGVSTSHTGLSAGVQYFYEIIAKDRSGRILAISEIVAGVALATPKLGTPEADADEERSGVSLSWSKASGADRYNIYRSTAQNGKYEYIASVQRTESYLDTTAKAGVTYYYKVRAYKKIDGIVYYGGYSEAQSGKIVLIGGLTVAPKSGVTMTLSWNAVSGIKSYDVMHAIDGAEFEYVKSTSGISTSHTGLTAGTRHHYLIRGKDANGQIIAVSEIKAGVALATPTLYLPEADVEGVYLSWSKASGADRYNVYRSDSLNGKYTYIESVQRVESYTDTTAEEGNMYYYKVRPYKKVDGIVYYGGYSEAKSGLFREVGGFSVSPKSGVTMTLTWNKVPGASFYEVWHSQDGTEFELVKSTFSNNEMISTSHTGLTAGTRHYYEIRVKAKDGDVERLIAITEPKAAVALATPNPYSPEVDSDGITLSWSKASGADRYNIYRSTSPNGSYTYMQSVQKVECYTDTTAVNGVTYYYKIRAYKKIDGIVYYGGYSTYVTAIAK